MLIIDDVFKLVNVFRVMVLCVFIGICGVCDESWEVVLCVVE